MVSTNADKPINWGGLDRDTQLLRVAAREIADAGPRAIVKYAAQIHLLAELADCVSRKAYADLAKAAQRARDREDEV